MTAKQIRAVMKYHLKNFNDEGVTISDETVHSQVLADDDGYGGSNSKAIYKGFMRWTFWKNDHADPTWPQDWVDFTVSDLADALLAAEGNN